MKLMRNIEITFEKISTNTIAENEVHVECSKAKETS